MFDFAQGRMYEADVVPVTRMGLIACATVVAALLLAAPAPAAVTAEFVKDLNTGVDSSEPGNFVNVDGVVFFTRHGR